MNPTPDPLATQPPPGQVPLAARSVVPWLVVAALLLLLAIVAVWNAWGANSRVRALETELVRRLQTSSDQAAEARAAARQAQEVAQNAAAKMALLEARVAESSVQRSQIELLMQSVARTRDENVLADAENAIRVALQQSALTGSSEPLLSTLQQIEERLARYSQPQVERVRRAVSADLDRVRSVAVADIASLTIRLDEAIRQIDELPLLATPERRASTRAIRAAAPASTASAAASAPPSWVDPWLDRWSVLKAAVWGEVRALVRVTPIDLPEAVLITPENAFFLRENVKLRLLNARLALLSRQFDTAQSDLRDVRSALDRYFDRSSRKVQGTTELVRQVAAQSRLVTVPRPDATLAAIAAAAAGR